VGGVRKAIPTVPVPAAATGAVGRNRRWTVARKRDGAFRRAGRWPGRDPVARGEAGGRGFEAVGAGGEPQPEAAGRAGEGRSVVVSRGHGFLIPGWCDGFRDRGSGGELVSCWLVSVSPVAGLIGDPVFLDTRLAY
jgi:hypothetical protein